MRTPVATPRNALIALLLAVACATPRVTPRPAHASFDPLQSKATTDRALEAVRARGYELAFHDAARGLILTRTREGQVTCGLNECLARDTLILRLDAGRAVAVLSRQLFDPSLRYWEAPRQPAFLAEPPTLRLSREGEPCAGRENCERGLACESRRCRAAGASTPPARLPAP